MTLTINCPNCSAPIEIEKDGPTTIHCPYCNTSVDISQEMETLHSKSTKAEVADETISNKPEAEISSKLEAIRQLAAAGDKIGANKLLRESFELGLEQADGLYESMHRGEQINVSQIKALEVSSERSQIAKASAVGGSCLVTGFIVFIVLVVVVPILIGLASDGGPLSGLWSRINPFAMARMTLSFGKEGTGPGYFTDARYVAVDNNGHIFVGEYEGGRIQVFDENGKYLTQWKAKGDDTGNIYITGMAAGRDGGVYTVVGSELYVYDGLTGNLLGKLDNPAGLGFDDVTMAPDGSVVASWWGGEDDIIRIDRNQQVNLIIKNAIGNVTEDSEMEAKLAVDGTGNIYDLAFFNQSVFIFSPDGRYISRFGSEGDAKGQFTSPTAIAVDNLGRIYIADDPGVMVYASDGRYLKTLSIYGAVMGITFDDQNNLYVVAKDTVMRYKIR